MGFIAWLKEANQQSKDSAAANKAYWEKVAARVVCPHCNTSGRVTTKPIVQKKGISGGKAVAALATGGVSMAAVGLSRKEHNTRATCGNCHTTWTF